MNTNKIAELNDNLRKHMWSPGHNKIVLTRGVCSLPLIEQMLLLKKVRDFNEFNKANDPYKQHDFGRVEHNGTNYFFKIDYYNLDMDACSDDASNPDITIRVLTIMRSDEY
jgi:hypothetical protein